MDSVARPAGDENDRCLIPDLRGIPLNRLASLAAHREQRITDVVSRIIDDRQSAFRIPAMMFNSTI